MRTTKKQRALGKYLEVEPRDIDVLEGAGPYKTDIYRYGRTDFLVLTDREADRLTKEMIRDSLWTFNPSFLAAHTNVSEKILQILQHGNEDANDAIFELVRDFDYLVEDAISCDGRGSFISMYDGVEEEEDGWFIYRM